MANYRIGRPPELNLQTEKALLSTVLEAIQSGLVRSGRLQIRVRHRGWQGHPD